MPVRRQFSTYGGMFGVVRAAARAARVRLVFDLLAFGAIERQPALGGRQRIAGLADQHFVRHRHLVEPDAEPRAILLRLAGRVVVHLPVDVLAGGNALADVGAMLIEAAARHPRQQLARSRQAAFGRRQARASRDRRSPCRPCRRCGRRRASRLRGCRRRRCRRDARRRGCSACSSTTPAKRSSVHGTFE